MADVDDTIRSYQTVCKINKIEPHDHIMRVFNNEKEELTLQKKGSETRERMYLSLAGNKHLKNDRRLTDDDVDILYKTLKNNTYVTSLDIRYNRVTDKGAQTLAKLIEETPTLIELNVMCNDIGSEGAEHIANALHKNETLRILRLNGNKMGNKGGMCFAQALQISTTLEALDLGDTDLTTESLIALATVLNHNRTLKCLNVNRPVLFTHQEEPTYHFARMLKMNKTLEELHMQKYDMRDFGATRLADDLSHNFHLKYLNLSCNRITRDGTKELARLLKENTPLQVLDLGFNRLENDGAKHLAEALATYNVNLTTLVITSNNIEGDGLCAIADAMKINNTLTNIYIWGNVIEESACTAFAGLIDSGRLKVENTDIQPYVVDGVTYVSELSHGIRRHYYYTPTFGGDVPKPIIRS